MRFADNFYSYSFVACSCLGVLGVMDHHLGAISFTVLKENIKRFALNKEDCRRKIILVVVHHNVEDKVNLDP